MSHKNTPNNITSPKAGEYITASWTDSVTQAANRSNTILGYNGVDGSASTRQTPYVNPLMVRVRNTTNETATQYQVLHVSSPFYTQSGAYPQAGKSFDNYIRGSLPTGEDGEEFVIVDRDCPPSSEAPSVISGPSFCKILVETGNEDCKFAKTKENVKYLVAAESGPARIVWRQTGTGEKWAYVVLDREGTIDIYGWLLTADWNSHNNDGSSGATGATPTLATFTDYPPWSADYSSSTADELDLYPAEKNCEDAWYYPRYSFVRIGNDFTDGNFRIKDAHVPDMFGWVESDMTGYGDSTGDEITVKLQTGTFGNAYTIQAYPSIMNKGITIETGTAVLCRWFYRLNRWVVIEAACAPDDDYTPSTGGSTTNS